MAGKMSVHRQNLILGEWRKPFWICYYFTVNVNLTVLPLINYQILEDKKLVKNFVFLVFGIDEFESKVNSAIPKIYKWFCLLYFFWIGPSDDLLPHIMTSDVPWTLIHRTQKPETHLGKVLSFLLLPVHEKTQDKPISKIWPFFYFYGK